jgi:predicted nucleic acid-binding Zn finger protein
MVISPSGYPFKCPICQRGELKATGKTIEKEIKAMSTATPTATATPLPTHKELEQITHSEGIKHDTAPVKKELILYKSPITEAHYHSPAFIKALNELDRNDIEKEKADADRKEPARIIKEKPQQAHDNNNEDKAIKAAITGVESIAKTTGHIQLSEKEKRIILLQNKMSILEADKGLKYSAKMHRLVNAARELYAITGQPPKNYRLNKNGKLWRYVKQTRGYVLEKSKCRHCSKYVSINNLARHEKLCLAKQKPVVIQARKTPSVDVVEATKLSIKKDNNVIVLRDN